jgi:hypothetical protein
MTVELESYRSSSSPGLTHGPLDTPGRDGKGTPLSNRLRISWLCMLSSLDQWEVERA